MENFKKALLFVVVNILGFLTTSLMYFLSYRIEGYDPANLSDEQIIHIQHLLGGTFGTWTICALFSISYFFLRKPQGLIFLWASLVIPLLYGLSVLY